MSTFNEAPKVDVAPELIQQAMDVSFEEQLEKTFGGDASVRGSVVKGLVTAIENDFAILDIGMKSEGRVPLREFVDFGKDTPDVNVGDEVDVFVENLDNRHGEAQISLEKAKSEEVLEYL
ncbi:MAG: S1 RNA-binding domain-containing protein [Alphaproteobacteria bacterium]|nr:S1 RNA-binding domain-containing protein [Alphaproteobacteria bacterium]